MPQLALLNLSSPRAWNFLVRKHQLGIGRSRDVQQSRASLVALVNNFRVRPLDLSSLCQPTTAINQLSIAMALTRPGPLSRLLTRRSFGCTAPRITAWSPSPSPPRLPKEEQEIFEQLQRQSTGAFSTPPSQSSSPSKTTISSHQPDLSSLRARINQSPDSASPSSQTQTQASSSAVTASSQQYKIDAEGSGQELHPDVRRGARPEFEGDTNPTTGEVGGPKNEPLRWGGSGDWSYNGRVTDF